MSGNSNATQRAINRIAGEDSYPIFIASPANGIYVLDCYVPTNMTIVGASVITASGTITVNVQRIRSGVTTSVAGLSALAASSTRSTTTATGDDTGVFVPGDQLQVTTSANAAGVSLAISVRLKRIGNG